MCGIVGFVDLRLQESTETNRQEIERLTDTLIHRGPDDRGVWSDPEIGVYFGHRRLSVIDLSLAGHQPMMSASGRYLVVYNGEVYNFQELRQQCIKSGDRFRGNSDTEVLLALIDRNGLESALRSIKGMFAFGLWDKHDRILHLARDRVGEKPLYYGWSGGRFIFASELKAIRAHKRWNNTISRDSLASFMRYSYVPTPWSIFSGIFKLPPGAFLSMSLAQLHRFAGPEQSGRRYPPEVNRYWHMPLPGVAERSNNRLEEREVEEQLHEQLKETIRHQIVSDV